MPSMNKKEVEADGLSHKIAIDVLSLKVGETVSMNFKDGEMVFQRIK